MRIVLLCEYCGHHFTEFVYDAKGADHLECPKCKDKNLKVIMDGDDPGRDCFGYHKTKPDKDPYVNRKK